MVGIIKRVPRNVIFELEEIKKEHNLTGDRDAFIKMKEYSIVGREVERMKPFQFLKRRR